MTKENILEILKQHKEFLHEEFSVSKIGLFGSYAKEKQTPQSDIDFYVEFEKKSFDNLAGLWVFLEELFHRKIDIAYKPRYKRSAIIEQIEKEVVFG